MNPLEFKGEKFLTFYVVACGVVLVLAACLRWLLRGPGRSFNSRRFEDLDAYEIATISGGEVGAIRAAIASLFQRGVLVSGASSSKMARGSQSLHQGHPLEMTVLLAVPEEGEASPTSIERGTKHLAAQVRARPESLGLLLTRGQDWNAWLCPLLLSLLVPLLGLIKIGVGIGRGKSVEFLVILVIGSVILFFSIFRLRKISTRAGDAFLKQSQKSMAALKSTSETSATGLTPGDVALAFALFGPAALSGATLSKLRSWYTPAVSSGWSSGSCSSSCGGSSCGGGCGGGGCGGCGS